MRTQLVVVENQSTVVNEHEFFNIGWALNYQARYHLSRSPWGVEIEVMCLPKGRKPPVGAWVLNLLDISPEAGTLGYHEDEQGTKIPFSNVYCKTAKEDGVTACEVASHELCEMCIDPYVESPKTVIHEGKQYIVEICDPVEGSGYDVGTPENRPTGMIVANFCYPAWYKLPGKPGFGGRINMPETKMAFIESVKNPFELDKEGYQSVAPVGTENWTQIFGSNRDKSPAWHHRPDPM